jgi:phosphoadenosine phosphosulfate reductase
MGNSIKDTFAVIESELSGLSIPDALTRLSEAFPGKVTFSTSFSYEDQVITSFIAESGKDISIFTLDTGRLFPETYSTWTRTLEEFKLKIQPYYPEAAQLESFIAEKGPNSFYESVENRKQCCDIRKVVPLKKALAGNSVWITGLRAEHSPDRKNLTVVEWDEINQVIKYNPLLHWTTEEVILYIRQNKVPYNSLHEKGFVSIGCAPCTRAIRAGEDFRAGRWWWEDSSKKECGLHVHATVDEIKSN